MIDPSWRPNYANQVKAREYGLNLSFVVAQFIDGAQTEGIRRKDWDRTFGALLLDIVNFDSDRTFPWVDLSDEERLKDDQASSAPDDL